VVDFAIKYPRRVYFVKIFERIFALKKSSILFYPVAIIRHEIQRVFVKRREEQMLSKKGKGVFTIASLVSLVGCIIALYFGHHFFGDRGTIYWVYNVYILILAGIVVLMAYRYLKIYDR